MKFLILNFLRALVVFIKALLNATYEINPIDYSHKTVAHYNTYHTSITEWSILKPLITVLRTWYILPVHYISVQYSHSNSTPYMDTPNCPVMQCPAAQSDQLPTGHLHLTTSPPYFNIPLYFLHDTPPSMRYLWKFLLRQKLHIFSSFCE